MEPVSSDRPVSITPIYQTPTFKPFVVKLLLKLCRQQCMFFSSAVPMCQVSVVIILSLYNISSAAPVVGVSLSACNDLYHSLCHESLISPLTQCCKAKNNNNNNNNNRNSEGLREKIRLDWFFTRERPLVTIARSRL